MPFLNIVRKAGKGTETFEGFAGKDIHAEDGVHIQSFPRYQPLTLVQVDQDALRVIFEYLSLRDLSHLSIVCHELHTVVWENVRSLHSIDDQFLHSM